VSRYFFLHEKSVPCDAATRQHSLTTCLQSAYWVSDLHAGPPRIDSSRAASHVVTTSLGESLRLVCPVSSDPPAYIDWSKDGDAIHIGWQRYRIRSHDSVLVVRGVDRSDAGFFQCTAVNGFGSVVFTFNVIVRSAREYVVSYSALVTRPFLTDGDCTSTRTFIHPFPFYQNSHHSVSRPEIVGGDRTWV